MRSNTFARCLLLGLLVVQSVKCADDFWIRDIKVNGLQRISLGTVYNYLPVNVGDNFTEDKVAPAIRALFKTCFFKDITLGRDEIGRAHV